MSNFSVCKYCFHTETYHLTVVSGKIEANIFLFVPIRTNITIFVFAKIPYQVKFYL